VVDFIVRFFGKTIGKLSMPFVNKEFPLRDYFKIESRIKRLDSPFVVGLVKTKGLGSNFLISTAQRLTKNKTARIVHAFAHVGILKNVKHRVVESVDGGVHEVSLLEAIGQRDTVILRRPNPKYISKEVCDYALEYIRAVEERDSKHNISYDHDHNYSEITLEEMRDYSSNNIKLDCSETIMQAINHGFRKVGIDSPVKMTNRCGKFVWAPGDIYFSELFITFYDSKIGILN